jgi:hypothetical protein
MVSTDMMVLPPAKASNPIYEPVRIAISLAVEVFNALTIPGKYWNHLIEDFVRDV